MNQRLKVELAIGQDNIDRPTHGFRFMETGRIAIPDSDREWIRLNEGPPPDWKVWIAKILGPQIRRLPSLKLAVCRATARKRPRSFGVNLRPSPLARHFSPRSKVMMDFSKGFGP
jgi:hypothetical protein